MGNSFEFDRDWAFQEKYLPEIEDILRSHAYIWSDTRIATAREDTREATDVVGLNQSPRFAVRIRRGKYLRWKDLTIRSNRVGYKTELEKIKAGAGDFYLYCWTSLDDKRIAAYWLVDMNTLRKSGLLDRTSVKTNTGGNTSFIAIKEWELKKAGALLVDWSL